MSVSNTTNLEMIPYPDFARRIRGCTGFFSHTDTLTGDATGGTIFFSFTEQLDGGVRARRAVRLLAARLSRNTGLVGTEDWLFNVIGKASPQFDGLTYNIRAYTQIPVAAGASLFSLIEGGGDIALPARQRGWFVPTSPSGNSFGVTFEGNNANTVIYTARVFGEYLLNPQ